MFTTFKAQRKVTELRRLLVQGSQALRHIRGQVLGQGLRGAVARAVVNNGPGRPGQTRSSRGEACGNEWVMMVYYVYIGL